MIQPDMKRRNNNLLLYLLLNVLVSAGTTLAVLYVWDYLRPPVVPPPPPGAEVVGPAVVDEVQPPAVPEPTATLPPTGQPVIEIRTVVGAGDLAQEVVVLQRAGEGNLRMTGWRLEGEQGQAYVFPDQPELVLFEGGAVQVFTHPGDDTATEVYWDRTGPAWQRGETIRLFDTQGAERASYTIP
jgi:hypothetical protein